MYFLLPYLNTSIAGVLLAILLFSYCLKRSSRLPENRKQPPEAAGAWPLIGHLRLLGGPELPHFTLGALAEKYGPIFTIRIGVHRTVVVSSSEIVKECFTINDVAVSSRPKLVGAKHLDYNYAGLGFTPYGSYWRDVRKIAMSGLLSGTRLMLVKHVRESEAEISIKELYNLWLRRKDGSGYVLVDMKKWVGDLMLNVILRVVAGKRYFVGGGLEEVEAARRCRVAFRKLFHQIGLFVVADAVPCLGWLDLGGHEKEMKKTAEELDCLVGEWLEEHRKRRESGGGGGDGSEQDFMDEMMSILDGKELGGFDADTIVKATCSSLISGGTDTTTVSVIWALSLLLNNPSTLKKAQEELDIHVGNQRLLVTESDINNLPYLQAIVKETLRLYPAGPLSGIREITENCTIGGYQVLKGTRLMVNLWKIQTDPGVWPEPFKFRPERFLTTHKNFDVKGHNFELLPFGGGRRACPGLSFALQVMHLTLGNFLHAFNVSNAVNEDVDMTGSLGLTNGKATPLEVLVSPRLPPKVYE